MAFEISELLIGRELPTGWSVGLVGDIAKVNATSISKKSPPKKIRYLDISSVGTRVFEKPKLLEYSEAPSRAQRVVVDGDTLISTVRPNLRAFAYISKADENLVASTGFACVTANNKNDSQYLHYFLTSEPFVQHLIRFADGAAYPAFDYKLIPVAEIPLPPTSERKSIGQFLGAFDDRITLLRETNQTLEAIAQALFKSWFVDFDPVRAKAEGNLPEGIDAATAALFPDAFEETELGLVPRGWEINPIGEVVETLGGGTPDTKNPEYWEPPKHNWTTPKDLSNLAASVLLQTERKLSDAGLSKVSSGLLPAGTLLMSSRAPIGYLAISHGPIAINQGYIAIPPNGRLSPLFMLFWCKFNMEVIKARANGSTFMEISKKAFKPIPAIVPSTAVLEFFESIAASIFSRVVSNEEQIQSLTILRDTLLPRLISGQLQMPDAEQAIEKATA